MRDTWFGDNRDLVKWGTLAHIAEREKLNLIVQVPYFRTGDRPPLRPGDICAPIHTAVWDFFRDVAAVEELGPKLGLQIIVLKEVFDPARRKVYRCFVVEQLSNLKQRKVVLLDPDTGIAPSNGGGKHSTAEDIQAIWEALRAGDWMVVYQHASRTKNWREQAQQKLASICGSLDVEVFAAPKIASDVAFLAAEKPV